MLLAICWIIPWSKKLEIQALSRVPAKPEAIEASNINQGQKRPPEKGGETQGVRRRIWECLGENCRCAA
jgi:hypothetical protein